jgi:hypothetical protein
MCLVEVRTRTETSHSGDTAKAFSYSPGRPDSPAGPDGIRSSELDSVNIVPDKCVAKPEITVEPQATLFDSVADAVQNIDWYLVERFVENYQS